MSENIGGRKGFRRDKPMKVGSEKWKKYVEEKYIYKCIECNYHIMKDYTSYGKSKKSVVKPSKYEKAYEIYLKTGFDDQYRYLMNVKEGIAKRYRDNYIAKKRKTDYKSRKTRYIIGPYKIQRQNDLTYLNMYKELHPLIFEKSWLLDRLTSEKNNELGKNEFLYTEFIDDLTILNMHRKLKEDKKKDVKDIVKMHIMCKEEIEEQEHEDEE